MRLAQLIVTARFADQFAAQPKFMPVFRCGETVQVEYYHHDVFIRHMNKKRAMPRLHSNVSDKCSNTRDISALFCSL
jgi:hypothetical protein